MTVRNKDRKEGIRREMMTGNQEGGGTNSGMIQGGRWKGRSNRDKRKTSKIRRNKK